MKKLVLTLSLSLLGFSAFAAEGTASVYASQGKSVIMISGDAADELYRNLEVEPTSDVAGSNVKVGKNIRCVESGDETSCTLKIEDGGKNGVVSLHGL